jgi:dihydrofolate synthase / folylpolyglutamate synthase
VSKETEARVDAILARLLGLHPKLIDLSLDRMKRLLHDLGDPQDAMPNIVHVAGTNGKGSTLAFLRSCLEGGGRTVNVFSKPHLVRFNERIRIAGKLIDDESLIALLEECERVNAGQSITFFEITTAAAFLAFARRPADVTLIETGLGGRFDASNVFKAPRITAITPVSLDHQHFLGDTVAKIAFEKAGIFKPGVPAVLAPQAPEAETVLVTRATEIGAPLFRFGQDWRVWPANNGLHYESRGWNFDLPRPGLLGRHQYDNAGTAIACLDRAGFDFGQIALAEGLRHVEWPARLERLDEGKLVDLLPAGWELWLDGGHNQAGGAALGAMAREWQDKPLHLVFGMLESHDATAFLRSLAPSVAGIVTVAVPNEEASRSPDNSAAAARAAGAKNVETAPDIATAVRKAATGKRGRVLICGSLYLAGSVLAENNAA